MPRVIVDGCAFLTCCVKYTIMCTYWHTTDVVRCAVLQNNPSIKGASAATMGYKGVMKEYGTPLPH